jgi:HK97 family phage prohead protease
MELKFIFAATKGFDDSDVLEAIASTGAVDRDNESIDPAAWAATLDRYRTNPVILATHQHRLMTGSSPVIGSAPDIAVADGNLKFKMRFAGTALGKEYEQLYREKHMRAFSVGFIPRRFETREVKGPDGTVRKVYVHTEVDLLEISAVPVPANPEALARAVAAGFGIAAAGPETEILRAEIQALKSEMEGQFTALGKDIKAALMDGIDELKSLLPDDVNPVHPRGSTPPAAGSGEDGREGDDGANAVAARAAAAAVEEAAKALLAALKGKDGA